MGKVDLVDNVFSANACFFAWYSQLIPKNLKRRAFLFFKKIFKKRVVAFITNDIRIYIDDFNLLKKSVNVWVSPNSKISEFLEKEKVKFIQIPFYVSNETFFDAKKTKEELVRELGIEYEKIENKTLIGSFQRDSLGSDLSKPKWHKNPDLLLKICQNLPQDRILLILAGPRRHYIIKKCRELGIPYLFVGDESFIDRNEDDFKENNLDEGEINLLYNLIDFYIVSSKSEGGPKAIMEASLAKTMIFSTDVGLAKDFLHESLIYDEDRTGRVIDFILKAEEEKKKALKEYNYKKTMENIGEDNYLKLYKKLIGMIK